MPEHVTVVNRNSIKSNFSADRFLGSLVRNGLPIETIKPIADGLEPALLRLGHSEVSTDDLRFIAAELTDKGVESLAVDSLLAKLGGLGSPVLFSASPLLFPMPGWFGQAGGGPPRCKAPNLNQEYIYSRGNNDPAEIQNQLAKTGKNIYQTGQFKVNVIVDSSGCLCDSTAKNCKGDIKITTQLAYEASSPFPSDPVNLDFSLVEGPTPSALTTKTANGGLKVTIDAGALPKPKPKNKFVQPDPAKTIYTAEVESTIPCSAGQYHKRFWLNSTMMAVGQGGLCSWVDCVLDVTAPKDCELDIALSVFFVEFREKFDFTNSGATPGAPAELQEIEHEHTGGANAGKTHNIAKPISEAGKKVDNPFPAKAP